MKVSEHKKQLVKQAIAPLLAGMAYGAASLPAVETAFGLEPGGLSRSFGAWSAKPVHDHESGPGPWIRKHLLGASDFPEPGPRAIIRNDGSEMLWIPSKEKRPEPKEKEKIYRRGSSNREDLHGRMRALDSETSKVQDEIGREELRRMLGASGPSGKPRTQLDTVTNLFANTVKSHPLASLAGTALASYVIYKILNSRDRYY